MVLALGIATRAAQGDDPDMRETRGYPINLADFAGRSSEAADLAYWKKLTSKSWKNANKLIKKAGSRLLVEM